MAAQVVRLGNSIAERYARLMAIRYNPEDQEEAVAEYMDFAERMVAGGFTHADLDQMIDRKRANLIRQLSEINRI